MAGRDASKNLYGLFANMQRGLMDEGNASRQFTDSFRRSMAPDVDMDDPNSLMRYADYARRNGYDEEAQNYLQMSQTLRADQEKKLYETETAQDTEKLRGINSTIANMNTMHSKMTADDTRDSSVGPMPNAQLENLNTALMSADKQRSALVNSMNARGQASRYGNGVEGNNAERLIAKETAVLRKAQGEEADAAIARRDAIAKFAETIEQSKPADWETFVALGLSKRDFDAYREGYATQQATLSQTYGSDHPTYIGRMAQWATAKLEQYKEQGARNREATQAIAPAVGNRALASLINNLDTQKGMGWLDKVRTDQADAMTWLQDPDNQALISQVMTSASSTVLLTNPELKSTPSKLDEEIQREFIKQMSGISAEFGEEYTEDVVARSGNRASASARTAIENMATGYGEGTGRQEFLDAQSAKFAQDLPDVDPATVTSDWVRKNHNDLWQEWNRTFTKVWQAERGTDPLVPYEDGVVPAPQMM